MLQRVAVALVTVFVCTGITSLGRTSAWLFARPIELASESARAKEGASAPERSHHSLRDGATRAELKAVEPELEDEDPLCDVPAAELGVERIALPYRASRAPRGELRILSHLAAGTGLPRGPPA